MVKTKLYNAFYKNKKQIIRGDWVKVSDRKSNWYNEQGMVIGYNNGWVSVEIDIGYGNTIFRNFRSKQLELINRLK